MVLDSVNISASPGDGAQGLCNCGFRAGIYICLEGEGVKVNVDIKKIDWEYELAD